MSNTVENKMLPLVDGNDIPQLGLAAFRRNTTDETIRLVTDKFNSGIRHFEIAVLFGNGHTVMQALNECLIKSKMTRADLFITLKVWPKSLKPRDFIPSILTTMSYIGLEYIDLVMLHAPIDVENNTEQWTCLESMVEKKIAKSVGVACIGQIQLADLLKNCMISPTVLEMEVSPFCQEVELVSSLDDSSMIVMCNNVMSKGMRFNNPILKKIADDLGNIPVEQVLARWAVTKGYSFMLPADVVCLNVSISIIMEPLPVDIMELLDNLNENLQTTWYPVSNED